MIYRLSIILALLFTARLNAQSIKFEHYSESSGLSHNSVRHIVQDQHGFLWLGTFSGLNRFDGYQFKTYMSSSSGTNKMHNDDITALELDQSSNSLWIGTRSGLTHFDLQTQTLTTFLPNEDDPNSLPDEEVRAVYPDKYGTIWVGTKNKGLYRFSPDEESFSKVEIKGFDYIKEIFEDHIGNIWIGSYETGSVAKVSLDSEGEVTEIITYTLDIPNSNDINPYVNFIYEDDKSNIFVGTRAGLYKLDVEQDRFVNLYIEDEAVKDNLGPYFLSVARAANGQYWVGTLGGILVCDQLEDIAKGDFEWYYSILSDDASLVDNLISALYFDPSGVLWIGTEDGLDKYDPYQNQFKLNKDISSYIGNKAPRIRGFAKTKDERTIVATRYNGLFISSGDGFEPLYGSKNDIASIYSDDGVLFYCGLWNGEVLVYNYQSKSSQVIDLGFDESPVFAFRKISDDLLMIGSFGEGARVLNTDTYQQNQEIGELIPGYQINRIALDVNQGQIWIATETGLVKYDLETKALQKYRANARSEQGLPHDNVSDVIVDNDGIVWAATRLGLSVYDSLQNNFSAVASSADLTGKWITDIIIDNRENLWLNANNNNVIRYTPSRSEGNVYAVNSGNRLDVFSSSGFFYDGKEIFLGGKNGVIHFTPHTIKANDWSPSPFITEFKVENKEVYPGLEFDGGTPLATDLNYGKLAELPYANNNFSIQFSTACYANERQNHFEYRLEGFDEDWISAGSNSRTVQYTNLSPSNYEFKVRSSNSDGIWSDPVAYQITVLPPFWLTWQALLLTVIVIAIVFWLIRREVRDRIRLRQELLFEKLQHERDINLNNEKLRFFTNISHELRTPLTLVLGPAKQLISESKLAGNDHQLSRLNLIHENASRLLKLVNQILDFRKAKSGELKLKVAKTDILSVTKSTFEFFEELAKNKHISFTFNCEEEGLSGWIDKDSYDKVLYNLLSNALKFTRKNGHVEVFLGKSEDKAGNLVVEVSDDGIGIPYHSQKKIFTRFYQADNSRENNTGSGIGLSLTKSIVKLHKGDIRVKSTLNKGSIFTFEIPIEKGHYSEEQIFEYTAKPKEIRVETTVDRKPIPSTQLREKVLVIEDNHELRAYLAKYLSDHYKVYTAENGQQGLELCKQVKPAVCVVDVMMPVMDGLQFCEELKTDEFTSHTPVIMLTALSESDDKINAYDRGADAYLVKPFDPSLLHTRIENIIKSRLELKSKFSGEAESPVSLLAHSPIDEILMTDLTELIENNLSEAHLTTAFLCKELGLSSSKLYRKIKDLTDLSPNEFIRTVRLKKSAHLLKSRKYNVSEVTNLIGFNDPLYFSRCFKKQFGYPPSQLIK